MILHTTAAATFGSSRFLSVQHLKINGVTHEKLWVTCKRNEEIEKTGLFNGRKRNSVQEETKKPVTIRPQNA